MAPSPTDDIPSYDLSAEESLFRKYIERAVNDGASPSTVGDLIVKIGQLVKLRQTVDIRNGDLLPKARVLALGQEIIEIINEEIEGIPNHSQVVDRIIARIFPSIDDAKSTPAELRRIGRDI